MGVLFLGILFLAPRSWALCLLLRGRFVPGFSFLDVAFTGSPGSSLGSCRPIASSLVACLRVETGCFKGCFAGGLCW